MQRELHWEERLKSEPLPCESPASLVARSDEADEDSAEAPVDLADDDFPAAAVELAAGFLHQGYDMEVIEAHHRAKVDAPSGTALKVGERIAKAAGRQWPQHAVWQRHGYTGARTDDEIGFSVIRGGDIIGDHTVMFAGQGERIELTHRSSSRTTYATGALRAAAFVADQPSGLFDMPDVLGLSALKAK